MYWFFEKSGMIFLHSSRNGDGGICHRRFYPSNFRLFCSIVKFLCGYVKLSIPSLGQMAFNVPAAAKLWRSKTSQRMSDFSPRPTGVLRSPSRRRRRCAYRPVMRSPCRFYNCFLHLKHIIDPTFHNSNSLYSLFNISIISLFE